MHVALTGSVSWDLELPCSLDYFGVATWLKVGLTAVRPPCPIAIVNSEDGWMNAVVSEK